MKSERIEIRVSKPHKLKLTQYCKKMGISLTESILNGWKKIGAIKDEK